MALMPSFLFTSFVNLQGQVKNEEIRQFYTFTWKTIISEIFWTKQEGKRMLDARRRKIEGRSTMGGTEYPEDFDEPISEASHQTKATVRFWIGYQILYKVKLIPFF